MTDRKLLRERDDHGHGKVTAVELFFDLVFVFAVTQLSHRLMHHFSAHGAIETALLCLAVWWVWIYTSWVTNWLDPEKTPTRLLLLVLMLAGLVLSSSIPNAFDTRAWGFAGAYVFMQVGRSAYFIWAVSGHPNMVRNFQRLLSWVVFSAVFWIAGASLPEWRLPLWTAALAIEVVSPSLGFYVPGLGRSRTTDWDVEGGHFSERCGLFVIIALGESILVTGATFADLEWNGVTIAAFASAFAGSVAMWWIYFDTAADKGTERIVESDDPGRIARVAYTYLHVVIVAAIILCAVGDEFVLHHPDGHADAKTAIAVLGGAALYLLGNAAFRWVITRRVAKSHVAGIVALAALGAATSLLTPLWMSIGCALVLSAMAVWDGWRARSAALVSKRE